MGLSYLFKSWVPLPCLKLEHLEHINNGDRFLLPHVGLFMAWYWFALNILRTIKTEFLQCAHVPRWNAPRPLWAVARAWAGHGFRQGGDFCRKHRLSKRWTSSQWHAFCGGTRLLNRTANCFRVSSVFGMCFIELHCLLKMHPMAVLLI